MPEMVPVSFLDNSEALAPPISMFDSHPFLAKPFVLSFLFLGQLPVLRLLMRNFTIFMYLTLVTQVPPSTLIFGWMAKSVSLKTRMSDLRPSGSTWQCRMVLSFLFSII
jgi:hypothetical protein